MGLFYLGFFRKELEISTNQNLTQELALDAHATAVDANATGYIGVGWAYLDKTFDFVLPHEDGKLFDGSIHSPYNHKQRFEHEVLRHHPELRNKCSYTTLPRYRVYHENRRSVVVGFNQLMELPKFQHHVTLVYKLVHPVFTCNDHYVGLTWGPDPALAMETLSHWK